MNDQYFFQNRWMDTDELTPGSRDWRRGIRSMVAYAIKVMRAGGYDKVRFDCFNAAEVDYVSELMAGTGVPFSTTRVV